MYKTLISSFNNVLEMSERYKIDMRLAAYIIGIRKVAEACKFRGWA